VTSHWVRIRARAGLRDTRLKNIRCQRTPDCRLVCGTTTTRFRLVRIRNRPTRLFQTLNASRLSNALTASLGGIQRLTSHLTGSLSFARSFRAPTVQELFANGLDAPSGTYTIGTAGLGPEPDWRGHVAQGKLCNTSFEISPFANSINHYIYGFLRGDTIQGFPVRQFGATDARLAWC